MPQTKPTEHQDGITTKDGIPVKTLKEKTDVVTLPMKDFFKDAQAIKNNIINIIITILLDPHVEFLETKEDLENSNFLCKKITNYSAVKEMFMTVESKKSVNNFLNHIQNLTIPTLTELAKILSEENEENLKNIIKKLEVIIKPIPKKPIILSPFTYKLINMLKLRPDEQNVEALEDILRTVKEKINHFQSQETETYLRKMLNLPPDKADTEKLIKTIKMLSKRIADYELKKKRLANPSLIEAAKAVYLEPNETIDDQIKKLANSIKEHQSIETDLKGCLALRPGETDIDLGKRIEELKQIIWIYECNKEKTPALIEMLNLPLNEENLDDLIKSLKKKINDYESSEKYLKNIFGLPSDKIDTKKLNETIEIFSRMIADYELKKKQEANPTPIIEMLHLPLNKENIEKIDDIIKTLKNEINYYQLKEGDVDPGAEAYLRERLATHLSNENTEELKNTIKILGSIIKLYEQDKEIILKGEKTYLEGLEEMTKDLEEIIRKVQFILPELKLSEKPLSQEELKRHQNSSRKGFFTEITNFLREFSGSAPNDRYNHKRNDTISKLADKLYSLTSNGKLKNLNSDEKRLLKSFHKYFREHGDGDRVKFLDAVMNNIYPQINCEKKSIARIYCRRIFSLLTQNSTKTTKNPEGSSAQESTDAHQRTEISPCPTRNNREELNSSNLGM